MAGCPREVKYVHFRGLESQLHIRSSFNILQLEKRMWWCGDPSMRLFSIAHRRPFHWYFQVYSLNPCYPLPAVWLGNRCELPVLLQGRRRRACNSAVVLGNPSLCFLSVIGCSALGSRRLVSNGR